MTAAKKIEAPANEKPPEGFTQGGTPEIDGWYQSEVGVIVHGKIVGHMNITARQGMRQVILVKLRRECMGFQKGDKKGKLLPTGSVLGVGISYDLQEALEYVEKQGEIWFRATEKKELEGGNSLWKYEQHYKGEKALPPSNVSETPATDSTADDDDIPF